MVLEVEKLKRIVGIWAVGQMSPLWMELLDLITISVFIMAGVTTTLRMIKRGED